MRKITFSLVLGLLMLFTFFSGIIRHDVDKSKYIELAQQKQFDCVGQVFKDSMPGASCVLINNKYILSAAHVFLESDFKKDTMSFNGQEVIINKPINTRLGNISSYYFKFNNKLFKGKSLKVFPTFLDSLATEQICDIALIELSEVVKGIEPATISSSFDELNSNVVGVGYGMFGVANQPPIQPFIHEKIAGENVIDDIRGYMLNDKATLLVADFDHPTDTSFNKMGSHIPRPLEYSSTGGDSGGGLFTINPNNNKLELVGITSYAKMEIKNTKQYSYYGSISGWTRVSVFHDWIINNSSN